jgi:hypothetical protein
MDIAIQKGKANDKNKVKEKGNSPPNRKEDEGVAGLDGARSELSGNGKEESHFALKSLSSIRQSSTSRPGPEPVVRCRFHDGVVAYKVRLIVLKIRVCITFRPNWCCTPQLLC